MEIFRVEDIYGAWVCKRHSEEGGLNGALVIRPGTKRDEILKRISSLQSQCKKKYQTSCPANCPVEKLRVMVETL